MLPVLWLGPQLSWRQLLLLPDHPAQALAAATAAPAAQQLLTQQHRTQQHLLVPGSLLLLLPCLQDRRINNALELHRHLQRVPMDMRCVLLVAC